MSGSLSQEEIDALVAGADGDDAAEATTGEAPEAASPADQATAEAGATTAEVVDEGSPAAAAQDAPEPAESEAATEPEDTPAAPSADSPGGDLLDPSERDAIGEVGNICMSSAATSLGSLLGQPVAITTPVVRITREPDIRAEHAHPAAVVTVEYTEGLSGRNLFVVPVEDASVIADLMMGGSGSRTSELSDIHTSAVAEAMNQMMGAAAAAMAELVGRKVDISPPQVGLLDLSDSETEIGLDLAGDLVRVDFDLSVGEALATNLTQLMPLEFARALIAGLLDGVAGGPTEAAARTPGGFEAAATEPIAEPAIPPPPAGDSTSSAPSPSSGRSPLAQPVSFPALEGGPGAAVAADIGLLMDVPLSVSVELGRTQLRIRNVLDLVPGSIVELDKLAGEPVEVLVNGRQIARGEVVVIDEEFGVRITEIASQANRLRGLAEDG